MSRPPQKCPLCGIIFTTYPALSRVDSLTEICPKCGVREALLPQSVTAFKRLWAYASIQPDSDFFEDLEARLNPKGAK